MLYIDCLQNNLFLRLLFSEGLHYATCKCSKDPIKTISCIMLVKKVSSVVNIQFRRNILRICGKEVASTISTHHLIRCMNLRKKQLNYINIGAAGNKKFEPGLLSESNIIGLLCGRSGKSSFSGAPAALCRAAKRCGSDRNRYTLNSPTRAENVPIFHSSTTKRMHFLLSLSRRGISTNGPII